MSGRDDVEYVTALKSRMAGATAPLGVRNQRAALVTLTLAADGSLTALDLDRSSGDAAFDRGLRESVEGQVLWTLDGTESLRAVAQECLRADARRDASLVGPGAPGAAVPVIAVPLRDSDGDVDGVLYLVHVERVS